MDIKNKFIKINNGKKEYILHNYIYNDYLKLFIDDQLDYIDSNKYMQTLHLKFDEELEDYTSADYMDFDINTANKSVNIEGNQKKIIASYYYDETNNFYLEGTYTIVDLKDYYNKKITAIGFGYLNRIYACVDVSKYNIYLYENENLVIVREDVITSDAICEGVEYPYHLAPILDRTKIKNGPSYSWYDTGIKLYSIGLGYIPNQMSAEYIIDEDINVIRESDTSYGFNLKKGENYELHPSTTLYCGSFLYPTDVYKEKEIHPTQTIYPSANKFPMQSNYKYIIYKYEIYYGNSGSKVRNIRILYNEFTK